MCIDILPNYGPGTSKRYRKPVTTGNTVIFYCEKRNFRRSSDLAVANIYTCLPFLLSLICLPLTPFLLVVLPTSWHNYGFGGVSGVLVFGRSALLLTTFPTAWTSQNRAGHSNQPKKMLRKVSVQN